MKTIAIIVILVAAMLVIAWMVCLIQRPRKTMRWINLTLPLVALLFFVGLFVGAGISRNHIKKELATMQPSSKDTHRINELERKNRRITLVIGRNEEVEEMIQALRE